MIDRDMLPQIQNALTQQPVVGLLGPRQVGKTTLALEVARESPALYLDLEAPSDLAKLSEPELYLAQHQDRLVVLDEIQRAPDLFPVLRGVVDAARRRGQRSGSFLLLGSASLDLLQQSAESLAGRILYLELGPLGPLEVPRTSADQLWLRGGFPESFLAKDDAASLSWRQAFLRTYLERDIPQLGPRIPAETLRRFWTMLAHTQGSMLNASKLAAGLGVSGQTVSRYLDLLADLLLIRKLAPWTSNVGKRLVRSPRTYVRDSGLAHALLGIQDQENLLGHPVVGPSWEGFVIEALIGAAPQGTDAFFYRTAGGAEVDLILVFPDGRRWAYEIKRSLTPKLARGFYEACREINPGRRTVVYPGTERYPLGEDVFVDSLHGAARELKDEIANGVGRAGHPESDEDKL